MLVHLTIYCKKNLTICGIKFSPFNENDILAQIGFGAHDIAWLKKIDIP